MMLNLSPLERAWRVVIGVGLLARVLGGAELGLLGLLPLVTGITGFCPLYRAFRVSSSGRRELHG
jgi:DUF2892 family protein